MNNNLSPNFNKTNQFPFNSINLNMNSGPPSTDTSLDASDFPALGGSNQSSSTTSAPLLSSYASQAGTASSNQLPTMLSNGNNGILGGGGGGNIGGGIPTSAAALMGLNAREFSADDFPALGGFGGEGTAGTATTSTNSNGNVFMSTGVGMGGRTQEQASAAAALQHQQQQSQHRANLLGSMNGTSSSQPPFTQPRNTSGGFLPEVLDKRQNFNMKPPGVLPNLSINNQQPWSPTTSQPFPSNNTLPPLSPNNNNNSNSNGPLPILIEQQQLQQQLQQASIRSPSMPSALPPGVSLPLSNNRTAVGNALNYPSGSLPPHLLSPPTPSSTDSSLLPPSSPAVQNPQTPVQQVLFSPADRYGLLGLLNIIKTQDPDLSMLALGSDLTTLGLDLGATENLYSTFITPWSDSKTIASLNIEPEFNLPSCYNVQPPPAGTKIGNFSDETLFFIFYSQPRDTMQEMAAHELYKHNWRYHKDLRLWLTKEAGTEPTQKTQSYERGSYIVFDPSSWERVRKDMLLVFDSLERRGV